MNATRMYTTRGCARAVCTVVAAVLFGLLPAVAAAQTSDAAAMPRIEVNKGDDGSSLRVNGKDFMVLGMNWGYMPIGENYNYDLWKLPDEIIEAALAREMPLLQAMGVNTIRHYIGMPPRWVQYVYEKYGIYTVINHPMARYGFTLDGVWLPNTDYSNPRLREAVKADVMKIVEEFRGTPGVLMWLLGNENNYGLSWSSFEIEALPEGERNEARARHLYSLYGEITTAIQEADPDRPVAMANGDLQYIDLVAEYVPHIDIFGTNVYRGISARDLFQVVNDKLGVPIMFTEFGADAWNAKEMREDQLTQARYVLGQWQEIYEMSRGKGRVGNAIGGLQFQWSDGWWKYKQDERLDIHDTNASWPNRGYPEDYVEGGNNMNEEWWGITAKGRPNERGLYEVYPRAAYYVLQQAWSLDPYAPDTDLNLIRRHFTAIQPMKAELSAHGDAARLATDVLTRVRVSELRLEFETYSTGGKNISTPEEGTPSTGLPSFLGFDRMESYFFGFEAKPNETLVANLSFNVIGHVAENPIDEIFYENRGRPQTLEIDGEEFRLNGIERVKAYRGAVSWDEPRFQLNAFYRTGHFHWGYEGDFFGIYREANYGPNLDIYNGDAPNGFELTGKRELEGWKLAFGPQLWWGANPSIIVKHTRDIAGIKTTALFHEEFAQQNNVTTSIAVPVPKTRRATVHMATTRRGVDLELGGIWSGSTKIGDTFQVLDERDGVPVILEDKVKDTDTFGGKAKVSLTRGRVNWYAQGAYMGIVADGGPTAVQNFTGWQLKDTGLWNQANVMSGFTLSHGNFQVGPNFLYQKPLTGPIPLDAPLPGRPRNIQDDPFHVRGNREMTAGEIIIVYDPTPATWMWQWDNIAREDARFAGSLGLTMWDLPTTQDAAIGLQEDGTTTFAFPGAPPARPLTKRWWSQALWELRGRAVSALRPDLRVVANVWVGNVEARGDDARLIKRWGLDSKIAWSMMTLEGFAKFDDWGPYDYHRDFNYTYPMQLMGDMSYAFGTPRWFSLPQTRLGVRGTYRSLDQYSNRYCPVMVPDAIGVLECDPLAPGADRGSEWELRTYLHFAL